MLEYSIYFSPAWVTTIHQQSVLGPWKWCSRVLYTNAYYIPQITVHLFCIPKSDSYFFQVIIFPSFGISLSCILFLFYITEEKNRKKKKKNSTILETCIIHWSRDNLYNFTMSYSCQFIVFKHTRLSNNLNVIKKCILHHIHSINQIYDTCIWHSLLYTIILIM